LEYRYDLQMDKDQPVHMGYGLRWQGHFLSRQTERPRLHLREAGNMSILAMRQALEALETYKAFMPIKGGLMFEKVKSAITALSQSIEQADVPETNCGNMEPVAWKLQFLSDVVTAAGLLAGGKQSKGLAERISTDAMRMRLELFSPPTAPAQQPLTDEQIKSMCKEPWVFETVKQWVRIIEAAHGIKGASL
jgi:hypothetical protein